VREELPDVVSQFKTIRAEGIVARHHSRETSDFVLGPIDFEIKRGEMVFFVGHNGSGKTTFMNVLAGLLDPDEGRLLVDGKPLAPDDMAAYRARISAVFTNYHIFRELHGLEQVSKQEADEIIKQVWLYMLTETRDGKFTRLDLSAGQKRRLALAVTLLEHRDLIILDEYLADQDPEQRNYFFSVLVPMMKKQGKTIIFSTHDLQWIHCADKVYQFDNGKMKDITQVMQAAPKLETA
jgi:putative ATP-binding cassette transporter